MDICEKHGLTMKTEIILLVLIVVISIIVTSLIMRQIKKNKLKN